MSRDESAAASKSGPQPSRFPGRRTGGPDPSVATTAWQHSQTTSTLDEPGSGLLVQISIDGDNYRVKDFVGLRYGWANNVPQAIEMWANDVQWLLSEPREKLGDPLLSEADAYRKALPHG